MAVRYVCDWCDEERPVERVSRVVVSNVYNEPTTLHICWACGCEHMPEKMRPLISWTSS